MPTAGFCHDCGKWVWVASDGRCQYGHPAARVNAWYDSATGQPVAAPVAVPAAPAPTPVAPALVAPAAVPAAPAAPAPATPAPGTRDAFLVELMQAFTQYPGYVVAWGRDTDMTISNNVVDARLCTVRKKVDYEAVLKAVEAERVVYMWELLKEKGSGLSLGGMDTETTTFGGKRWGTTKETVIGSGGAASYEWDYGKTRAIVEGVAALHGLKVKIVLGRKKASW